MYFYSNSVIFNFYPQIIVPIRDIINCIKEEITKVFSKLKQLFESAINSIAVELLAVGLLTTDQARITPTTTPSADVIINAFLTGFLFLSTVERVTEHCHKFFNAMYNVGGGFHSAADSIKETINNSLLGNLKVKLDL